MQIQRFPLLQGKWNLKSCEFGGLVKKHLNYHNSQITVQPCIAAQTHKVRHIYKHKREQHVKTTNNW